LKDLLVIIFTCPFCGLQRSVSKGRMGKPIRCRGCEEVFTLTGDNSKAAQEEEEKAVKRDKEAAARKERAHFWTAIIEGALPGATAGLVAGTLAGAFFEGHAQSQVSWGLIGVVAGLGIGILLGGVAGVVSHRAGLADIWRHCPAPLVLGLVVGLASGGAVGSVRFLGWAALSGLLAAGVWPLLGWMVEDKIKDPDPSAEDLADETDDPADDTRHYIDPNELKQARRLGKRRRAE
jgi:hypothetical protein